MLIKYSKGYRKSLDWKSIDFHTRCVSNTLLFEQETFLKPELLAIETLKRLQCTRGPGEIPGGDSERVLQCKTSVLSSLTNECWRSGPLISPHDLTVVVLIK